jgi:NAD(P)-dependent dehydrogenase (short-subunit alcohol dehydrogenase family)
VYVESGLRDKVVLITGAGGMGLASARRFVEEGARVFAADVSDDNLRRAEEETGGAVHTIRLDVTSVADVERMVATVAAEAGRLDVLVNTVGVWLEGPSEEMAEAQWDFLMDVNLKGLFFCCSRAIPLLKQTQGCIVNVASDAGLVGTPETALYSVSKGGVVLLTKVLALELAKDLVRVNAVCPADVMSPMLEGQARDFGGGDPDAYFRTLLTCYPQGDKARFITTEEIAELIVYLCSKAAAPITGAAVSIDFGTTAGYGYS